MKYDRKRTQSVEQSPQTGPNCPAQEATERANNERPVEFEISFPGTTSSSGDDVISTSAHTYCVTQTTNNSNKIDLWNCILEILLNFTILNYFN